MAKRAFDVVIGTLLVVIALPLLMVLALAVCIDLRTWRPIFVQQRVGRGGARFRFPKLRSLPLATPPDADKYALASVPTTRLGALLRRTHLDELPQLLLVLTGRMSLVGPRPDMPALLERFSPAFVAARSTVRPGCTGLWQVGADAAKLIGEAPEYDLYYLRHRSFRLDCWILWRTVRLLLGGQPAQLAEVPTWHRRRALQPQEQLALPLFDQEPVVTALTGR